MPDHDHPRDDDTVDSPGVRRVAVIGGGANDEHEVSLGSAAAVVRAVEELGLDAVALTIERDGSWRRTADAAVLTVAEAVTLLASCDVAFPALHGVHGEDGAAAGFLDLVGVPVVGSPVRAGALGMDKWVTKTIAEAVGIRTARAVLLRGSAHTGGTDDADHDAPTLAPPFVVKPTTGGSSNGVSVVRHEEDWPAALQAARTADTDVHELETTGGDVLVEEFVAGREVDLAVFRDHTGALRTGAPLEIGVADGEVFGRDQKYDGTADFTVPASLTPGDAAAVEHAARTLYDVLGCAGVARFDFFVTADGVLLNEVNTCPGLTEQSQVPRMFAATGLPYVALVRALLEAARPHAH